MKRTEKLEDSLFWPKHETLFTQGNGYMGIRGVFEERYVWQTRNTFLAGVYNDFGKNEVSELVNLPETVWTELEVDGERVTVDPNLVTDYFRTLDLANGELVRSFVWMHPAGGHFQLEFRRFVSKANVHLLAQRVRLRALDRKAEVKWLSGIDGRQTNSGVQHVFESTKHVSPDHMAALVETTQTGLDIGIVSHLSNSLSGRYRFVSKRRRLEATTEIRLEPEADAVFDQYTLFYTSNDVPDVLAAAEAQVKTQKWAYDWLLEESAGVWAEDWDRCRIVVDCGEQTAEIQSKLDWALYHLLIMRPPAGSSLSIPSKGLTGEGYHGHMFWDTEIFMLPFFLHTDLEAARELLVYRYDRLPEAKKLAVSNGYEGAQFPWESALDGKEETPLFSAFNIRTGKRQPVASAEAEHHVTADMAYAVMQYWAATGDRAFMEEMGKELLRETARFWISRAEKENGKQVIKRVIGPDEYTEFVDNNAYTNYLAWFTVRWALEWMDEGDPLQFLAQQFLDELYLPVPNEDGILPQDDTFLHLPNIDVSKYRVAAGEQRILQDYSREEVNKMQVLKQADVVMLMYLFPDLFDEEIVRKNLAYYEKRTIHDSSLSFGIHAIVSFRTGDVQKGMDYFQRALDIDFGKNPASSLDGVHAAALGNIWSMITKGIAGIQGKGEALEISPQLPEEWAKCAFPYVYRGRRLHVRVQKETVTVTKYSGEALMIDVFGKKAELRDELTIEY